MFVASSATCDNPTTGVSRTGMAVVYEFKDDQWVKVGNHMYGDTSKRLFGAGVTMNGDGSVFAVTDMSDDRKGSVRVYQRTSSGWEKVGRDLEGENARDWFGSFHVDMSDNARLIVGSQY